MNIVITPLGRKLIVAGVALFLLGLFQGALIPAFLNPRMALSAHLAAVQSGMAMAIFGLIWNMVNLGDRLLRVAYYTNIAGMYAVWFAISLAAFVGASRALPIAGQGFAATPTGESAVELIVTAGALATVISVALIFAGLLRTPRDSV
ncbi:MAG: hydrogenase [Halioglobus sp.]